MARKSVVLIRPDSCDTYAFFHQSSEDTLTAQYRHFIQDYWHYLGFRGVLSIFG